MQYATDYLTDYQLLSASSSCEKRFESVLEVGAKNFPTRVSDEAYGPNFGPRVTAA
jgi:hypothetical protein